MPKDVVFEELPKKERIILLRAFDYDVDEKGFILDRAGSKILSDEIPDTFLHIDNVALMPGSLKVIDGSPTSISKFIRENLENGQCQK